MLIISAMIGAISCAGGTLLSAEVDKLPSGATIVLLACGAFAISFVFGTERGVWWQFARQRRLRHQQDQQHLLRVACEYLECRSELPEAIENRSSSPVPLGDLAKQRDWSLAYLRRLCKRLQSSGVVVLGADRTIQLTPRGLTLARQVVRYHRLLEHYMVTSAEALAGQADREADYLEHGLLPEHLAELEGLLDAQSLLPPSPHPLKLTPPLSEESLPDKI